MESNDVSLIRESMHHETSTNFIEKFRCSKCSFELRYLNLSKWKTDPCLQTRRNYYCCVKKRKLLHFFVIVEYLADSTYTYKPKYYYQLYAIHRWYWNYNFPLIYCFILSKIESWYIKIWANIKMYVWSWD